MDDASCELQASDRAYYLYQTLADIADALGSSPEGQAALAAAQAQLAGSSPGGELLAEVQAALADDFNTPLAVAAFSAPLKAANDLLQTKKASSAMHVRAPAAQPSPRHVLLPIAAHILSQHLCTLLNEQAAAPPTLLPAGKEAGGAAGHPGQLPRGGAGLPGTAGPVD